MACVTPQSVARIKKVISYVGKENVVVVLFAETDAERGGCAHLRALVHLEKHQIDIVCHIAERLPIPLIFVLDCSAAIRAGAACIYRW
jgi:hypothetical protein